MLPAFLHLALLHLAFFPPTNPAPGASWCVGVSRVEITPTEAVWMAGYASRTKPGEGKASPLYVRGLALRDPAGGTGLIIALDLVGIDAITSARWATAIGKKHQLPRHGLVFACSHTHCGPVVGSTLSDMYPITEAAVLAGERYARRLDMLVADAADKALAGLVPANLAWHAGTCGFAVNRRNNLEAEVESLKKAGTIRGPIDHTVPVLAARDMRGKMIAVLFGYACHATTLSFQEWFGDWPGVACENLEADGATAVFIAGCGADQNPLPRRRMELAQAYGRQLADAVRGALGDAGTPVQGTLGMVLDRVELPLEAPPGRDLLVEQSQSNDKALAARARRLMKVLADGGALPTRYSAPVQAWAVGEKNGLVFLPGEVVVDYALRLPAELPGRRWWIGSYCNDVMAYIPSRRVRREGGYEGDISMVYYGLPAAWREEVEEVLVSGVQRLVGKLAPGGGQGK